MKIIIGLGNPDSKYLNTFHNLGFMTLDAVAAELNQKIKKIAAKSLTAVFSRDGENIILAKPQTYMNLSGLAADELIKKFKGSIDDILVIYDDTDIAMGDLRLRKTGSGGTHNGVKNIVYNLRTEEFKRIRIGIGRPPEYMPLADYVLNDIPKDSRQVMYDAIMSAKEAVIDYINGIDFDIIMQKYNTK